MKKTRRLLALLLAMVMMLALTVTAGAEEVTTTAAKSEITVIYTNDVHTYIDKTLSYATVSAMKQDYQKAGKQVLLVDAGDHIQGTAYGGMDEGKTIVQLMNAAGYDLGTLGNHEFDYGMARALATVQEAKFPYVSCNFYHEKNGVVGDPVLDSYKVFDMNGTKVAFVGITTPESFTKSTPAYFQDANGKYIYGIAAGKDGSALYAAVQKAIDAAAKEADYVIALGHLGDDPSSQPWTSEEVIAHTTGLDAFIDGHSHSTVEMKQVKDKAGNTVVLSQTGSYFAAIGEMTIAANGTITTKLVKEYEGSDATVAALQKTWMDKVEGMLGEKIAETDIEFTINDAEGNRAVRKGATNLFDLNADAFYWYINEVANLDCDVAVMNGGGVRATIEAGDWTYKSCKTVNPFGNVLCLMKVPGQMILDALEFGSRDTPDSECGGFLSAAGLTYEIDSTVQYTGSQDDKGVWQAGPTGEYRVRNVKIYNKATGAFEPLDVNKTYTLGGINYTLRNQGDGFNMFQESAGMELVMEGIAMEYEAFAAYLKAFKDTDGNGYANLTSAASPLASFKNYPINYENAAGSGRTVVWTADNRPAEPVTPAEPADPGKAEPAKTGDMMVIFTAMTVLSGMGAAYVARKRED